MIAVISDVHANAWALQAVLRDIRRRDISEIYSLGDCVGYNAAPRSTLAMLRDAGVVSVKGNHDMMAIGELPVVHCGPHARAALAVTRSLLSMEERRYLRDLPLEARVEPDMVLLHSGLGDPVGYLKAPEDYLHQFRAIRVRHPATGICFSGHTHLPRLVEVNASGQVQSHRVSSTVLEPASFYFINPGSVGHPRGSDYRASYAIFERGTRRIRWVRVAYDRARTRAENLRYGIGTDLGPGVIEHALGQWIRHCKRALR